jgi:hypothetical protein
MWRIDKVWMFRAQFARYGTQRILSNVSADWQEDNAILRVELCNSGAATCRIALTEHFLKIAEQKRLDDLLHARLTPLKMKQRTWFFGLLSPDLGSRRYCSRLEPRYRPDPAMRRCDKVAALSSKLASVPDCCGNVASINAKAAGDGERAWLKAQGDRTHSATG